MKFYIKLIFIVLYTGFYGFAQTNINHTLGDVKNQVAYTIAPAKDNSAALAAGFTDGYSAKGKDILTYLVDLNGNGLLHKKLGGNGDEEIFSAITASDGNYVLVGYTNSLTHGGKDAFIAKMDFTTLEVIWQKHFGDIGDDEFYDVAERTEGNTAHYVAVGYTTQAGRGKEILYVDADQQGNLVRYNTFGGNGDDVAKSVVDNATSTLCTLAGWTSTGSPHKNALILTVNAGGALADAYIYDTGAESQFNQIKYDVALSSIYTVGYTTVSGVKNGLLGIFETDLSAVKNFQTFANGSLDVEFLNFQPLDILGILFQGYTFSTKGDKEGIQVFTDPTGNNRQITNVYTSCIGDEIVYDGVTMGTTSFGVGSTTSYGAGSNDLLLMVRSSTDNSDDCLQKPHSLQIGTPNFSPKAIVFSTLNSSLTLENTTLTIVDVDKTHKDICSGPVAAIVCGKTLSLGKDTAICVLPYTLKSKFKCADHLWSEGSTADSLVVTKAGVYSLTVSDGTCSLIDSIKISGGVSLASKQANVWYFGLNAGLNFNTEVPTVLNNGTIASNEGTCAISDALGNILFYSDGVIVRNKNHEIMANGTGLLGDTSATQSALIVPHPGDKNLYYLFTVPAWNGASTNANTGFNYNIIDISKNGGLGEVVSKNNLLFTPCSEKLTAVRHANGRDIWVIAHESNSKKFLSYLITIQGLSTTPVISNQGTTFNGAIHNEGQMKASPIGNKLWVAAAGSGFQLLDFNNTTGTIQSPIGFIGFALQVRPYGCEFSPDGNKIFLTDYNSNILRQMDISSGNQSIITATSVNISSSGNSKWGLQLAPNGKIYVVNNMGGNTLGVINNPNASGVAVNYQPNAITLPSGAKVYKSFPSFIQSLFKDKAPDFTYLDTCTTTETKFRLLNFADTTSLSWDFGDGTHSDVANALHQYAEGGSKTVSLNYIDACDLSGKGAITKTLEIISLNSSLKDTIACSMPLVLDPGENTGAQYIWSTTETSKTISVIDTGQYDVQITLKGCSLADTAQVILGINDKTPDFTYVDTCFKTNTQFTALNVPDTLGITWDFGNTHTDTLAHPKHMFESFGPQTVTLTYTDLCGLHKDTSKTIHILAADTVSLTAPKDTICFGESLRFTATYSGSSKDLKSWKVNDALSTDTGMAFTSQALAVGTDSITFKVTPAGTVACPAKLSAVKTVFVKPSKPISSSTISIVKNAICETDTIKLSTNLAKPDSLSVTWLVNGLPMDTTYGPNFLFKRNDLKNGDVVKFFLGSDLVCTYPLLLPSKDSVITRLTPKLTPQVSISSITNPLCFNEKALVKLKYKDAGNKPSFQWKVNGKNIGGLSTDTTFTQDNLSDGDEVTAVIHPDYTCPSVDTLKSNHIKFTIKQAFTPAIYISTTNATVCQGDNIVFKIDSIAGGGLAPTWEWQHNGVNAGNKALFYSNQFKTGDLVTAKVTSSSNCANPKTGASSPILTTVNARPTINLNEILLYCDQEQTDLRIDLGQQAGYSYLWSTRDTTAAINVAYGKYQVKVINAEGCSSEAKTSVIINCEPKVFIPTAFTPNSDGKNDKLEFFTTFTTTFKISFYDRWGEVIYSTDDPSSGWDGIYLGKQVPTGTYTYVCTYGGLVKGNQETRVIKGDVSVLE